MNRNQIEEEVKGIEKAFEKFDNRDEVLSMHTNRIKDARLKMYESKIILLEAKNELYKYVIEYLEDRNNDK